MSWVASTGERICEMCAMPFIPVGRRQRFCGSSVQRTGCSYKRRRITADKWRVENPEHYKRLIDDWVKRNPDIVRGYGLKYYHANKESRAEYARRWRENNPKRHKELYAEWAKANTDKIRVKDAKRRAAKLKATPEWADQAQIKEIYTAATRSGMEVDHIVPLKHPLVCGLHVPWNLQLLSKPENSRKNNRFIVA